jgi:cytochrome c peroxidase
MTIRKVRLFTAVFIALGLLSTVRHVLAAEGASAPNATPGKPYTLQVPFGLEDPASYIPKDNPLTIEKIELGKLLFFDPRLSADNKVACASCHLPFMAWTDGQKVSIGIGGQLASRNGMTIVNRVYSTAQLWDGGQPSLEAQALNPIFMSVRMGMPSPDAFLKKLNAIKGYRERFYQVFGTDVTLDDVGKALASFQRTILSGNSPADEFDFGGEEDAISDSAKRGLTIFQTKGRCARCHSGFNFTDEKFHNLGIDWDTQNVNVGRYTITGEEDQIGAFKTPTLREISKTSPYMHDGRFVTLEEVIEFYDKGGIQNPHLDNTMVPLNLTTEEKKDLVEYLRALNGEGYQMDIPGKFPQ